MAPGKAFDCAATVQESNIFISFGGLSSEKQIPRFVGNISRSYLALLTSSQRH